MPKATCNLFRGAVLLSQQVTLLGRGTQDNHSFEVPLKSHLCQLYHACTKIHAYHLLNPFITIIIKLGSI